MAKFFLPLFALLLVCLINSTALLLVLCADTYSRPEFPLPPHFVFGSGTSAYQGAAFEDGRAPSIWDTFAHAGQRMRRNATLTDSPRVNYLHGYVGGLLDAIRNGSNARGYFYWSFMDLFELLDGYETSYGLYYIDRSDNDLKRHPKLSAYWYSNFLKGKSTSLDGAIEVEKMISSQSQSHFSR